MLHNLVAVSVSVACVLMLTVSSTSAEPPSIVQDLEPALLILEDLTPGWIESFPGEQGTYTTTRCGHDLTAMFPTIARQFKRSDLGPVLLHEIVLAPPGEGPALMASVRDRMAACPEWVTTQVGRPSMRWRATEIGFPEIVDESFAFRSVASMLLVGHATGDHVTMRIGDVFSLVGYASIGTHDPGEVERYGLLALDKLKQTLTPADN
jgi:hypothetical protein